MSELVVGTAEISRDGIAFRYAHFLRRALTALSVGGASILCRDSTIGFSLRGRVIVSNNSAAGSSSILIQP
ncbi:MAG TPA: hypothetical protein VIF64_15660 [Pyrinomonadaceae bacterium]|jgi:hypothetical protein